MLAVLGLVDVVMSSNLLIMVIGGGYETFVSRIRLDGQPDQPERPALAWIDRMSLTAHQRAARAAAAH